LKTWTPLPESGRLGGLYRKINELAEIVLSHTPTPSIHGLTDHTALGWTVTPRNTAEAPEPSDFEEGLFVIKSIAADWLLCMPYDTTDVTPPDTVTDDLVKVARNYRNRTTGFDGTTVNGKSFRYHTAAFNWSRRKASQGGVTQMEVIVPPYYVNALIYAKRGMNGGTRVYDEITVPGTPELLQWIDSNDDARAWAKAKDTDPADDTLELP